MLYESFLCQSSQSQSIKSNAEELPMGIDWERPLSIALIETLLRSAEDDSLNVWRTVQKTVSCLVKNPLHRASLFRNWENGNSSSQSVVINSFYSKKAIYGYGYEVSLRKDFL